MFSLLNEVEPTKWLEIAGVPVWESLLPILTELFCSIDDMESAKVATIFFKRAKSISALKDKTLDCIELGKNRLLNELLRKIPGNMREALKIKDNTIMTLVLPLSHINLLKSLEIEDSPSILNMTKLIDEFVTIDEVYKTTIWQCSLKLVFHELMWKMLEYRQSPREEDCEIIIDLKDRLIDLLSPADLVPGNLDSLISLEAFERSCTEINLLSDLALLFSNSNHNSNNASWSVVILEDQMMALFSFIKMITRIVSQPLPRREDETFELSRAIKKSYSGIMASMAKLFSLEVLPSKDLSNIFSTLGFGDEISDAVVKVVIDRFIPKLSIDRSISIISNSLQESYLMSVMSSEYESLIQNTTISLSKVLRTAISSENSMFSLHLSSIDFFKSDCPQRSEFLGRVLINFSWNLTLKQVEELVTKVKSLNYYDVFVKNYLKSIEKIHQKGNLAQRLLMKRMNNNNTSNSTSPTAQKTRKLETMTEESENENENENENDEEDEKAVVDLFTQKDQIRDDQNIPSSPPALLRRKVTRY